MTLHQRLQCLATWFWKEWRDQRAVTIGILIAIPALTAGAFWAFGEQLSTAWLHTTRATFLGIALGLVNFAVASSLFAGETRRGTIQTLRRLPGALGMAFLAKLAYLTVLVVVAIGWAGVCLAIAEAGNGGMASDLGLRYGVPGGSFRAMALWNQLAEFPGGELWTVGFGMGVLCLWTLLVSTWLGRSGVAGVGSIVVLGVLAAPFALIFFAHPYFFAGPWVLAGWTAAISALAAVVAVTVSFLKGQRFAGRPLRPFLLGAAVLLVALGGGYAYAQVALDAWLEIDPQDEDFRIYEAHLGAGERYLYVTVHRGAPWIGDKNLRNVEQKTGWESVRGTPLQAWVHDIETGATTKVREGRDARYFTVISEVMGAGAHRRLEPAAAIVCVRLTGVAEDPGVLTWWDAATATAKRTLPWGTRDPVSLDLVRRTLAASTWHRDAQGRRVWLRDDILETEGALEPPPAGITPRPRRTRSLRPVPGGWYGWKMSKGTGPTPVVYVSAADGEERDLAPDYRVSTWGHNVLSVDHALGYEPRKAKVKTWSASTPKQRRILIPLAGGPALEPKNLPDKISSVLLENLVLALRGSDTGRTLHAWNPITGEDTPIRWSGKAPEGIHSAMVYGRTGDGRMLLLLQRKSAFPAWAVLTADARRATLVAELGVGNANSAPIAVLKDGAVLFGEEHKRVVRYAPGKPAEVLFPR